MSSAQDEKLTEMPFVDEWLAIHAEKNPLWPAVSFQDTVMNYASLNALANQVAHFLHEKKVRAGDTVAVVMERSPLLMAVMLGIFRMGGVFVPLNPRYPEEKVRFILEDCNTRLVLADSFRQIPQDMLFRTSFLGASLDPLNKYPETPPPANRHAPDAIAYIIYTSGTTGQPKGVMVRHAGLNNLTEFYKTQFRVTHEDRASQFASQGFDSFFCETIPFFMTGGSVHIVDDSTRLTPPLFFAWMAKHKISICDLPTSYGKVLFGQIWPDMPSLRLVKIGGESLTRYPEQIFSFDLWNCYGPTENTIEATCFRVAASGQPSTAQQEKYPVPPIGKPITHVTCHIVDSTTLQPVPQGSTGELLTGGAGVAAGYINRPELTAQKFIPDPFSDIPGATLYRTGDLVKMHEDGNIEYIGRIDSQIKIRGFRIELGEIESCTASCPDVSEVVVLAKENPEGQKSLIAWLVPKIEKIRIPWHEKCLLTTDDANYTEIYSEDISREGMAFSGSILSPGSQVKIAVTLPGSSDSIWIEGKVAWQHESRGGIHFQPDLQQKEMLEKSIEYYLATHNLMETLENATARRDLKKALQKKLPAYMIPEAFCILPRMPLTFNGKVDTRALPMPQGKQRSDTIVPPATETEKSLEALWKKILNRPVISMTDNFFDLGGNSLLVSELCILVREKFSVTLPAMILADRPYIPIIAEFIDSGGVKFTDASPIQQLIVQDCQLPDDLVPGTTDLPALQAPGSILLTGAGGFLGIYLLKSLLEHTDAKIFCMIRKGGFANIAKRFQEHVKLYGLEHSIQLSDRRIVLLTADIAFHHFGLPLEQYENIASTVDCIYHCGAQVNTQASYTTLRASNVIGTREIIQFATHGKAKSIYYISTLSAAFKKDEAGHYAEVFPDSSAVPPLTGGYGLTKWVSERLLAQLMQRGLPVHIYRSGYILGDSVQGVTNTNDALLLLLKGCIQMGVAPDWEELIAVLPVDFVSEAVVVLSRQAPHKSGVFHIDQPNGLFWTDFVQWFVRKGYPIKICSHHEWLNQLAAVGKENALYPFLSYYLSMDLPPVTPHTALAHAAKGLEKAGVSWPAMDDKLLNTWLDFLIKCDFLPRVDAMETT